MLFQAGKADALARAVLDLLDRPDQWPVLRAAGRRFVEHERNWARSASHYVDAFANLVPAPAEA